MCQAVTLCVLSSHEPHTLHTQSGGQKQTAIYIYSAIRTSLASSKKHSSNRHTKNRSSASTGTQQPRPWNPHKSCTQTASPSLPHTHMNTPRARTHTGTCQDSTKCWCTPWLWGKNQSVGRLMITGVQCGVVVLNPRQELIGSRNQWAPTRQPGTTDLVAHSSFIHLQTSNSTCTHMCYHSIACLCDDAGAHAHVGCACKNTEAHHQPPRMHITVHKPK